jgi:type I restriction enzyme, R subunit
MRRLIDAKDSDIFDVLAYVRFSLPPKTLHERADGAHASGLSGARD